MTSPIILIESLFMVNHPHHENVREFTAWDFIIIN